MGKGCRQCECVWERGAGNVSVYGKGVQAESLPTPPFFLPVTYTVS
jgi:hypothetical protein